MITLVFQHSASKRLVTVSVTETSNFIQVYPMDFEFVIHDIACPNSELSAVNCTILKNTIVYEVTNLRFQVCTKRLNGVGLSELQVKSVN